jgi:hypothetical protein
MKEKQNITTILAFLMTIATLTSASAQVSQEVLDSISTPDKVETSIGTLEFFDGAPSPETAEKAYDIYFAPKAPEGYENNWLETVPGKSWFTILRIYGPLEPWIEKTWRPGEIELVK